MSLENRSGWDLSAHRPASVGKGRRQTASGSTDSVQVILPKCPLAEDQRRSGGCARSAVGRGWGGRKGWIPGAVARAACTWPRRIRWKRAWLWVGYVNRGRGLSGICPQEDRGHIPNCREGAWPSLMLGRACPTWAGGVWPGSARGGSGPARAGVRGHSGVGCGGKRCLKRVSKGRRGIVGNLAWQGMGLEELGA